MKVWLKGGPLAGCEVLIADGSTSATYPLHYASGTKAVLLTYRRTGKFEMEYDAAQESTMDIPRPVKEPRTLSILARARIRAAMLARAKARAERVQAAVKAGTIKGAGWGTMAPAAQVEAKAEIEYEARALGSGK